MKFDTSKEGLFSVFKPYQLESLKYLMTVPSAGSGRVWEHLHTLPDETVHMSRASIIFFLNDMVDDEICTWVDATGKGGHHRLYSTIPKNESALMLLLTERLESFIKSELTPITGIDFILKPLDKLPEET